MRFTALLFTICLPLNALTIQIDYSLDSNNFFSASGNPGGATGVSRGGEEIIGVQTVVYLNGQSIQGEADGEKESGEAHGGVVTRSGIRNNHENTFAGSWE